MGRSVHISADIIDWPEVCASCCRASDDYRFAKAVKKSGVEVVRTQTKKWRYPFCSRCDEWLKLDRDLMATKNEARRLTEGINQAREFKSSGYSLLSQEQLGILALVTILTMGIGLICLPFFVRQRRQECQKLIDRLPDLEFDREEQRENAKRLSRRMDRLVPADVVPVDQPVEYASWYRSLHTFWFGNAEYARRFIARNRKKIVDK